MFIQPGENPKDRFSHEAAQFGTVEQTERERERERERNLRLMTDRITFTVFDFVVCLVFPNETNLESKENVCTNIISFINFYMKKYRFEPQ